MNRAIKRTDAFGVLNRKPHKCTDGEQQIIVS